MRWIDMTLWVVLLLSLVACGTNPPSVIPYEALPESGDPVRGEQLFTNVPPPIPTCASCHSQENTGSPLMDGYAEVAGTRVEGVDAREYTFYSIVEPGRFIVEGYGNAMYNRYDDELTPQDIADLIAYVMTK